MTPEGLQPVDLKRLTPRQIREVVAATGIAWLDWGGRFDLDLAVNVLAAANGLTWDDLADVPGDELLALIIRDEPADPDQGEGDGEDDPDPSDPAPSPDSAG